MKKFITLVIALSLVLSSMLFTNVFAQTEMARYAVGNENIFEFEKGNTYSFLNGYGYFAASGYSSSDKVDTCILYRTEEQMAGSVYSGTYSWMIKKWESARKFYVSGNKAVNVVGDNTSVLFNNIEFENSGLYRVTFMAKVGTTAEREAAGLSVGTWSTETSFSAGLSYTDSSTSTITSIATSDVSSAIVNENGWTKVVCDIYLEDAANTPEYIEIIPSASYVYYYIDDLTFAKIDAYKNTNNFDDDATGYPATTYVNRQYENCANIVEDTNGDNHLWLKRSTSLLYKLIGAFDGVNSDVNGKYRITFNAKTDSASSQDGYVYDTSCAIGVAVSTSIATFTTSSYTDINSSDWTTITYEFDANGNKPNVISFLTKDNAFLLVDDITVEYISTNLEIDLAKDENNVVTVNVKSLSAPVNSFKYIVAVYDDGMLVNSIPVSKTLADGAVALENIATVDVSSLTKPTVKVFSWDLDDIYPLRSSEEI